MLQMSLRLKGKKILYVTGEESEQQTKMRADRIGNKKEVFKEEYCCCFFNFSTRVNCW